MKMNKELHRKIVLSYVSDSNKTLQEIANELKTTLSMVNSWTTKYLSMSNEQRKEFLK